MAEGDKIFFVFSKDDGYLSSYGYVEASSGEEVAKKLGGELRLWGEVVFAKELFVYNEEMDRYIYHHGKLTLHLQPHQTAKHLMISELQKLA
jgi:hypothetical protein